MTADPTGLLVERVARALAEISVDHSLMLYLNDTEAASLAADLLRRAGIGEPAREMERLTDAVRKLLPYLDWTLGPDSPGHHPTLPSAVREVRDTLASAPAAPAVASESPSGSDNAVAAEAALCSEIVAELARARAKFPGKNVTFAALVEEVGELAKATFEESAARVRKEAIQVAVMAMRMILDGDHTYEAWRLEKGLDPLDPAVRAMASPSAGNASEAAFRAGDHVLHGPTGETWLVAWCEGDDLAWCGWPNGIARTSDCTLVKAATDVEHVETLRLIAKGGGSRAARAAAALRALEDAHA